MKKALVILALAATASTVQAEQVIDLPGQKCFDFTMALNQNGILMQNDVTNRIYQINDKVVTVKCSYDVRVMSQAIVRTQEEYNQNVAAEKKRREENILAYRQKGVQLLKGYGL